MAVKLGWPCWVGVVAKDLDAQRRFYRDVLGLAELAAGADWVQFDLGDKGVLELVQRSHEPQYDQARYQVGYAVTDIESARDQLVARGVQQVTQIEGEAQPSGRWCYFATPKEISSRSRNAAGSGCNETIAKSVARSAADPDVAPATLERILMRAFCVAPSMERRARLESQPRR